MFCGGETNRGNECDSSSEPEAEADDEEDILENIYGVEHKIVVHDISINSGRTRFPFGAGRRKSLGGVIATRVLGLTFGTMIQAFEWDRFRDDLMDMTEGTCFSIPEVKALDNNEVFFRPFPIHRDALQARPKSWVVPQAADNLGHSPELCVLTAWMVGDRPGPGEGLLHPPPSGLKMALI
ncbi:hypothetical protein RD792_017589 [Penstemon davidsonii]|uniref:Uncharacterized protein n=1 Tax=Penstemon davidsonii TaxID=160366 RepID=A0ABR0CNK3_9LAMI|nr:hypothetical protein RD792_017589 [Penstemon davidsonii]